ncbi:keto-deoxy-phosphogluconate aldolase [Alkalilimnicola ehrlichii]|uniref:2-dehydro-3-deoxy-phosphogluconate aldolase n=1 Tax=Alkalilimnicola ehrlichii TaxID=351052 RepID=A0A3E0WK09_9GAMM|nr:bifunctional 4-hydroxy-2-oxoglutarate aldolase/2-dehydro-3-deoxy-phosphogluconate aldolase [Alkalilimnicola ehrlichii]RFA25303.1 keto-deoxy-phosphogluconate aldolase [Alkalilimnicola ehrlichii]RFA32417.1 keto-deoxy-phosphogluconate aldolase [Alkalilimnicola ehrlichii]
MNMREIMGLAPVIPVLSIEDPRDAVPLAEALVEGGLPVLEITLRTPAALDAAVEIMREVPGAVVGIGTVLSSRDFRRVKEMGFGFAVSPGLTPSLVEASKRYDLPFLPGVMTPSEVMQARAFGFRELKLFPAVQAGGVDMLKALAGPFPDVTFCPTGGVTAETCGEYLALPNVACVGGSWLAPSDCVEAGDWARIQSFAAAAGNRQILPVA